MGIDNGVGVGTGVGLCAGAGVAVGAGVGVGSGVEPEQPATIAGSRIRLATSVIIPDFRIFSTSLR
jgi:hypothetical protein